MLYIGTLLLTLISFFIIKVICDEAVVTLDATNFDSFIKENPRVLVEFYAPWCGHCKALAPEYEKAAEKIHVDNTLQTKIAKIDASDEKHKTIATKYRVRGFPTLKFFTNGDLDNPIDYSGGRTEAIIISWIQKRSLPAVTILKTTNEISDFKQKSRIVLVGYVNENSDEYKALSEVAETFRESLLVGVVTDKSLTSNDVTFGDLYIYRDFDTPSIKFTGQTPLTVQSITTFLNEERFPLIDAIGPENYKDYMDRGLPLVWIAMDITNEENIKSMVNLLTPFATTFKGKLSFIYLDAVKYAQHVQNLGIPQTPGLLIVGESGKYLYKGAFDSSKDLEAFFKQYGEGKLESFLRSQPIPETNDEPVYVLVGKSFTEIVGKDKDVFVEFYAPWCGHCKRLAPEYEKVGSAFSDVDTMVIAKIDATENDTPEEIKGFPTLIFYPKNSKKGEKYNGDRTSKAIIDWLKSKATGDVSKLKSEL